MQVETALFFETVEEIYARVFRSMKPRTAPPTISVQFRKYANANSRIRWSEGSLRVSISDLLQTAPAPIQEALASILLAKLFRALPDRHLLELYQGYLNRAEIRKALYRAKKERGRKAMTAAAGRVYDLTTLFCSLNEKYFEEKLTLPTLGWSMKASRTTLGHYDPAHHAIVLTRLLDSTDVPKILVEYVLFHEMLHIKFPTEQHGLRRCIHTKLFRKSERQFAGYDGARLELKNFVNRKSGKRVN